MTSSCRPEMVVGSYVLEEQLGAGGMAEVWKARHAKLGSPVAIKFLLRELGHDRVLHKRFENEARVAADELAVALGIAAPPASSPFPEIEIPTSPSGGRTAFSMAPRSRWGIVAVAGRSQGGG